MRTGLPLLKARLRSALTDLVIRRRRHACVTEARARWRAVGGRTSGRPRPESRSQEGEDALLWDLIGDRETGFFVEAGAYDGYTFSVSYVFECAGWNGLLVEPLASRAADCAARRPASRVLAAALSHPGAPDSASFMRVPWFEMYSGFEPADPSRGFAGANLDELVAEETAVLTLDEALDGHSGPIDFVVLDVEGHEAAIFQGFDLDRWKPTALLVEDNSSGRDLTLRHDLERRGYHFVASLSQNDLFVRRDEIALVHRLNRLWYEPGPLVRR